MAGENASQFDQLVAELDTLAKALPADKDDDAQAIAAAAAEGGGEAGGDGDADDMGGEPDGDADDMGGKKPMAKSFQVTLEDGTTMEAVDGAEMVKSLQNQVANLEGSIAKALTGAVEAIKAQGEMIKSLNSQVRSLRSSGAGRKTAVSVHEPVIAKSMPSAGAKEGISSEEFMAKAMDAFKAGRIAALDVATVEACINRGEQPAAHIVKSVLG